MPKKCTVEQPRNQVSEMHILKFPNHSTFQCWKNELQDRGVILDVKIASALKKIIMKPCFKKKVSLEDEKAQREDRFLRGRQIAYTIHEYVRVIGAHEGVLDYSDLFRITSPGDDIQDSDTRWNQVLLSTSEVPIDKILESLYKMRTRARV